MEHRRHRHEVIVEAAFDITGRGAAVVFTGSLDRVPVGRRLMVVATPPAACSFPAQATIEFALYRQPQRHERMALLVAGRSKDQFPPGTRLMLAGPDAGVPMMSLDDAAREISVLDIPGGWRPVGSARFDDELKRELPQGHLLFDVPTRAAARRDGSDDVLFATQLWGAPFVKVHLTYRTEADPNYPRVNAYDSGQRWVATEADDDSE